MDLQFWIYLIVAIIYLVTRAMKKSENQPKGLPDSNPQRTVKYDPAPPIDKPKTLTFEELLREITEAKQARKTAYETVQPESKRINYDDEVVKEERSLEDVDYNYRKTDKLYDTYEEGRRQAFLRPSLEETMKLSDTEMKFGKFREFEEEKQRNLLEEYTKWIRDPEGIKKAFVMSEILNRKF